MTFMANLPEVDGKRIQDSTRIVHYIDDAYAELPRLYPVDLVVNNVGNKVPSRFLSTSTILLTGCGVPPFCLPIC